MKKKKQTAEVKIYEEEVLLYFYHRSVSVHSESLQRLVADGRPILPVVQQSYFVFRWFRFANVIVAILTRSLLFFL